MLIPERQSAWMSKIQMMA